MTLSVLLFIAATIESLSLLLAVGNPVTVPAVKVLAVVVWAFVIVVVTLGGVALL